MTKEDMNIVIVGHVDHGKSTIIGRLLADTDSLPEGKLEQIKLKCRQNSKPFEYAFLLDALKDEQAQGITIDIARCFFKSHKRNYMILDAPGHIEFLKNMITGAAHAEAGILVVDAKEGIQANTKRHAYMLSMIGIKQLIILINKMDLVAYDEKAFKQIKQQYLDFLNEIKLSPISFIPVSGINGDMVVKKTKKMPWYKGNSVLEAIDNFKKEKSLLDLPFRMHVQDIYKFTDNNDDRRIIAGKIESGFINVGDKVIFYPSGKTSTVKSIEGFNNDKKSHCDANYSVGFTLTEQIYVKRGEVIAKITEPKPKIISMINAKIFWLGKNPLIKDKDYFIKLGTAKVRANLHDILEIIDASTLNKVKRDNIERYEVTDCIFQLGSSIAIEIIDDSAALSRFVILDDYDIAGGGIIYKTPEEAKNKLQNQLFLRNYSWIGSEISREERAERYQHKSQIIIITGKQNTGRKKLARTLERKLFEQNKKVYYLGIGNVVHGVDADINNEDKESRKEHLRRFSEILYILLDAGEIVIVTALELTQDELDILHEVTYCDNIFTVWLGDKTTNLRTNLTLPNYTGDKGNLEKIIGQYNE